LLFLPIYFFIEENSRWDKFIFIETLEQEHKYIIEIVFLNNGFESRLVVINKGKIQNPININIIITSFLESILLALLFVLHVANNDGFQCNAWAYARYHKTEETEEDNQYNKNNKNNKRY